MRGQSGLEAVRQSDWEPPIAPCPTGRFGNLYGACDALASSRARMCLAIVGRSPVPLRALQGSCRLVPGNSNIVAIDVCAGIRPL
jgi:hypothetical protein